MLASLVTLADPRYAQSAASSALTLVVTVGALWLAALFADLTAHLAVHGRLHRVESWALVRSRSEVLATAVVPLLLVTAAGVGWWQLDTALLWAAAGQVFTLGVVGVLAVRGTSLSWPVKTLVVLAEVALGLVVVAVKLLAH